MRGPHPPAREPSRFDQLEDNGRWRSVSAAGAHGTEPVRRPGQDEQYSVRGDILEQLHHAVGKLSLTHAVPEASPRLFGQFARVVGRTEGLEVLNEWPQVFPP